jgi:hypothetical protein
MSLKWLPGVAAEQAAKYWAEHAPIALRAQPAMTKYEQNLVTEVTSWTRGTLAPADWFAEASKSQVAII